MPRSSPLSVEGSCLQDTSGRCFSRQLPAWRGDRLAPCAMGLLQDARVTNSPLSRFCISALGVLCVERPPSPCRRGNSLLTVKTARLPPPPGNKPCPSSLAGTEDAGTDSIWSLAQQIFKCALCEGSLGSRDDHDPQPWGCSELPGKLRGHRSQGL